MKTYNEIDIKYYDNDGNIQVRCSVPVTQDALVHYELMQSHYCKLSFKLTKPTYFLLGDFIDTPYGRFELIDLIKAKDNDTIGYSYEIQFDAYYRKLKNKILKYRPNTGSQEATFSLTSKISTHVEVIMKSLAYYAKLDKSYLYDPKFEGEGTDYTYVIDASVDANAAKLITYSNTSMLDAIANIAQTFECEWWFEGNILHFGTCENTNAIVDFRLNDNIVSMSSSQSQSTYANRVYAFGAARNLPSGYKNDADADLTKDGVVEKRLMLPTSAECSDKNKQLLAENGFELENGYIQVGGLHEDQYVEGVTTNDDIYPRNLIKTSKVTSYEKDVEDESTPEEGDYIKRTFYRVNSLAIVNDDGEKTGDMAFRKAYILSGKNLHIVFQSGSLNGMDFECEFNPDGVSEILRDNDGNPILKDGKEQINPKSQVFEIVANEDYGRFLPDTALHPKDGDTFVLYNWDSTKLGDTLVSAASNELLTDAIKNLKKSMIDPTTYTCTAEANYSFSQGRGNFHGVGDRVNLYNKGYDDSYRSSRIIGYELNLDIPYDGAKYYVGEKPSYSRLNAMESKIEELVYNGQSYLNGNGGGGKSIYIIKSYDKTAPTDYNVYSAKAVDEQRLNKLKDDTAKGTITWEKVQKFVSGLLVGNFNAENGGSWTPDTEGRSHLITDYLEVRMKAIFEELAIKKNSTIGGKEIISPAGGVAAYKVDEVTVTYNDVSQKAYRCYFLAEQDGDEVDNDFVVEDQVRSESFNLNAGKYHKTGNHFFWRMVIGIDEEPVELEGKKYHYIDLSDTDCATASDVPAKGDVLSQCGNRTDVERQNCLIFSAVDTYSPSIGLYHGINSYSFANKEYVEYGVNKKTNKAFFNVYGDMYVGDRPTKDNGYEGSSYVKYDSATKQVVIKGKLSAKSTVDGKELSQYIKENSAKGLTEEQVNNIINNSQVIADLQNQVDGAIETWFYDGVPTLTNAPASSWTTNKDKDTHLGDLYYDNKTGKAYRFAKDGNTYKWTIIMDTDIAKALADASKAQETADGKMKVFSSQPTPPYQVGDIWVNATYPSDGSTYKNEVLRCHTDKKAGSQFAIADWIKASKYTDDTVANAAKKAAEEAKKAAETAQTNITNLGKTVIINKKAFDSYVKDGYLEPSEIAAMAQDSKRLEDDFSAAEKSYNEAKGAEVLKSTKELTDLNTAFATLTTAKTELVTYLSDISSRYNAADTNGKATIVSAVGTKFTNFQSAYSAFYDKLGLANAYITSKIYGDLKQNITDLAGYKYIKDALGQTTDIDGGLVMTTLLALRDADGNVQSGINGAIDTNRGKKSIATWWGGQMVDKDYNSGSLTPATSLVRFDGSGYLANGAIWWDVDGKVHADPTSFIISEKNLGAYLAFFEPIWKSGSNGTNIKDLVALTPQAPFTTLSVSNDLLVEGKLKLGSITLSVVNGALKIDGNVYSTGGMSAYGEGTSNGGGLNGSIVPFDKAKFLTAQNEGTEIASAWSIKKLYDMINSIDVTGQLTDYLKKTEASTLYQPKGNYLTSHQDISGKSDKTHTHSVKINGVTKTIAATGGTAVDLGTYLTSHQSLAAYLKSADAEKTYSKLGHTHAFSEITGKPTTLAGYGVTDGVNTVTLSGSGNAVTGASISGHTLTLTKGTTFSVSGHTHTFASLTSKPTTIAGYGITDAYTKAQVDSTVAKYLPLAGGTITGALTVNGIATFKSKVAIGDIYIINDGSGNLYVQKTDGKTAANFYATGGITAFGASSVSGGTGGGLNGSVLGFEKATAMTSADNGDSSKTEVSFLATAWSIKQLNDKINAFGTGVFSDYLTIAAAKATYQPKGSYLTSHQTIYGLTIQKNGTSLGTYTPNSAAKTINVTVPTKLSELSNDSGYTKNTGTVTSVAVSVPTGLSVSGSPITTKGTIAIALASGYSIPTTAKQTAWDGAVSAKHTHSNKSVLDGITSAKVTHWDNAYDWYALMTTDEETADGIINKWNEVVSFLANIAQTDTLSGIVDGINKSISDEVTRAKKAEGANASGISTNKTNITTLQGYFTSGSAKKALQLTNARKLWGNSFNGTADINGSIIVPSGKYISIGNIKLEYDATNKALKITNTTTDEVANLYTSGGVSAYGVGTSPSSGGGLNGTVKSYNDAKSLTSESLSEVASAYSVAALYSSINDAIGRINTLEGGSATSIEVTGSGNAVTGVSKSGTKLTFTKGATFLTSHQDISGKSDKTHTHSVKINGVIKTIAATGGTAVDLGTYLTSHQSLDAYLKSADAEKTYSKLGHTHSYAGSASAGGDATRALKLKDYNGSFDIYCGFSGASLLSGEIGYMTGIKFVDNIVYYKDVSKGELQKWLNLGARAYDNTSYLPITGGTLTGNLNGTTAIFGGRIYNSGDDEGILIKKAPNNWAGLILGSTDSDRSCFYLGPNGAFWKYVENGSEGSVQHPRKNGTMALTSDIPTKLSSLSNDSGYITSSGSCAYATSAGNSDKVDGVHVTWAGALTSTSHLVAWEADGSALRDISPSSIKLSQFTDDILSGKYLPLGGGAMSADARISASGGNLFIGNANNRGYVCVQNMMSQASSTYWQIRTNGAAKFKDIYIATSNSSFDADSNVIEDFNSTLCLNWYSTQNINMCNGGGNVNISGSGLHVSGNILANGGITAYSDITSSGIGTFKALRVGNVDIKVDDSGNLYIVNKDGTTAANFYATGGISAYGTSSAGSGGGLSGSVLAWDSAIKMPNATNGSSDTTKTESSFLASAWSIKQLYNKVTSLEGGSAMNVSVSGSGNAVTSISKSGTTISVVKGSTFLTAHQSLAGYMKTETADAKYMYHSRHSIVSDLNSFATNGAAHIYEMYNVTNRPNSNSWVQVMNWGTGDSNFGFLLANDYSVDGHMYFRQKLSGSWKSWKTIIDSSNIGSQSVNYATSAGSVAWTNVSGRPSTMKNPSALSWSGYSSGSYDGSAAKSISIPNNTNQLTNGAGFITSSASITGNAGSATKLQTTRTLWGQSFNGTANISGSMTGVGDMTLDAGARIKHGSGNLYIGNSDNSNWIGVQDICSQSSIGDGNWSLRTSGAAHFKDTTINGTATIKNLLSLVDGSHKGLKMGSTYISSLDGEVILQGNTALRFGNDAWDYNQWAGLKYDHSSKTVYLGIADGSIFKANSAQSGGVINLKQGISSVYTPALYAGGDIYHTGVYRMLWKNSKASKYLNVMNISQDDNGILTIGYGNFSNNKNVVLEGYNLNFRVGNDSGTKSMWLNYNNGNPVLSLDGNFYATGGVTAYKSSDERLKHDIHGVDSLAIIKAMGGTVAFRYNADNKDSIGWIAQRVLHNTFMQDLVEKDDKGFLKINYWSPKLIAVAFGAIEQVDDEVSRLKRRVRDLENEVEQLKSDRL